MLEHNWFQYSFCLYTGIYQYNLGTEIVYVFDHRIFILID